MSDELFRYDLHCHTTASDGTASPEEIIDLALQSGLKGLSITDHDTILAYEKAVPYAEQKGFPLISGIEFSSIHLKESVHILAYGFNLQEASLNQFIDLHKKRREERFFAMLKKLNEKGIPLTLEDVPFQGIPGRPHLAQGLVNKGVVKTIKEAFDRFLGDQRDCYVESLAPSVQETLDLIKKINGVAIIAHPQLIRNNQVLLDLLNMDFDGIEARYANFNPSQSLRWLKIGKRKNWLLTGGSDFHGANKPSIQLGASFTEHNVFEILRMRYDANKKML